MKPTPISYTGVVFLILVSSQTLGDDIASAVKEHSILPFFKYLIAACASGLFYIIYSHRVRYRGNSKNSSEKHS